MRYIYSIGFGLMASACAILGNWSIMDLLAVAFLIVSFECWMRYYEEEEELNTKK